MLEILPLIFLVKKIIDQNQELVHIRMIDMSGMLGERIKVLSGKLQDTVIHYGNFDQTQSLVDYGVEYRSDEKIAPAEVCGQEEVSYHGEGEKYTRFLRVIKTTRQGLRPSSTRCFQNTQPTTENILQMFCK